VSVQDEGALLVNRCATSPADVGNLYARNPDTDRAGMSPLPGGR